MDANTEAPVIDWERKFHEQVSDNIRGKAVASAKLADALLQLDQARTTIAELQEQVRKMTPAAEKLRASEARREEELISCARKVQEANARTRAARDVLNQGRRAVIEDVVVWLQRQAAKMPQGEPSAVEPDQEA